MSTITRRAQKGFTLIEALVAFGVTATGFLAVVSLQGALVTDSAYSKARSEAMSLAQQKIEEFKHYTLADEAAYIDNDGNGVMDADGNYSDPAINGQNAVFTRSWQLSSATRGRGVDVTVAWADSANRTQSVFLAAVIPWISPRSGADQLFEPSPTMLNSPTGRAELGEGELSDYPNVNPVPVSGPGPEGLRTFQNEENLLLVDQNDHVLLTLLDVCNLLTDECTDFVKISGTVYFDDANTNQPAVETYVIASDAAHCQRWVPSGTLTSPPTTATGSYRYFNYTCYLGGGWHGNLGFVTAPNSLLQTDKICQGDPTSLNAWEEPVIALRRAYRGMLTRTVGNVVYYESHGIKDATQLTGHDFVFTSLSTTQTAGSFCEGFNRPMTRVDSSFGSLFADTPTDFVCLNEDNDGDGNPDYLDNYDTSRYTAATYCPYDPTDPPVAAHTISGSVAILTVVAPSPGTIEVQTSDGPGNCSWTTAFASSGLTQIASYQCIVYDWGSGWTGYVQVHPLNNQIYCPNDTANLTAITSNQTRNFGCIGTDTVRVQGTVFVGNNANPITAMTITNIVTGGVGYCNVSIDEYRCSLPYSGLDVSFTIAATTTSVVCGWDANQVSFFDATALASPYLLDALVARNLARCP
jgi:Tfp pilus assembly protein PilV